MLDGAVYCSKCGSQSFGGAVFCQRCGARLVASAAPVAGQVPQPAYVTQRQYPPGYFGGFWIRVAAALIDGFILLIPVGAVMALILVPPILRMAHEGRFDQSEGPPPELIGLIFLFYPIAIGTRWLYEALMTSSAWQGTVGKRVLRLKVTDEAGNRISFGRATGRFFSKIISELAMYVGYIMVAFTDRKQGLHDMIAGTLVGKY